MQGLIHRINIFRRVTVGDGRRWETSAFITNLGCRIDSISPNAILRKQYASCTHSAVVEPNTDIVQGMRAVVVGGTGWTVGMAFSITGVRQLDAGVPGPHHAQLMLTEVVV